MAGIVIKVAVHSQGDYDKALENYKKSLQLRIRAVGPGDVEVAKTYNNIGEVYRVQVHPDTLNRQGLPLYPQPTPECPETREPKSMGPGDVEVAKTYNNIGEVYRVQVCPTP